jgi:hypothetical protein
MLYVVTAFSSKISVAMSRVFERKAEAFQVACEYIRAGYEAVTIGTVSGKRIDGQELEIACRSGQLIF